MPAFDSNQFEFYQQDCYLGSVVFMLYHKIELARKQTSIQARLHYGRIRTNIEKEKEEVPQNTRGAAQNIDQEAEYNSIPVGQQEEEQRLLIVRNSRFGNRIVRKVER